MSKAKVQVSFVTDEDTKKELEKIADDQARSLSSLLNYIVQQFLKSKTK